MDPGAESEWTAVYSTPSTSDAELVRTTLEVAGYRVRIEGPASRTSFLTPARLTVSVPEQDADDARTFLKEKTSLLPPDDPSALPADEDAAPSASLADVAQEILELRRQHEVAACKHCGIATLDVSELELDSRMIALLRAAGLGVNSATFSEFEPGERICSDCSGHEVACELCGRVLDAYLDEGEYRQSKDDEAYVCSACRGRLEDQLETARDW
jgi:hypothetical protein